MQAISQAALSRRLVALFGQRDKAAAEQEEKSCA